MTFYANIITRSHEFNEKDLGAVFDTVYLKGH